MNPDSIEKTLKYLVSKLSPDDQAELSTLVGEDVPDLAEDALAGRIAFDRLPGRIKRQMQGRVSPEAGGDVKGFHERYPDAKRIKV